MRMSKNYEDSEFTGPLDEISYYALNAGWKTMAGTVVISSLFAYAAHTYGNSSDDTPRVQAHNVSISQDVSPD